MSLARDIVSWAITLLQLAAFAGFLAYLWGLGALRRGRRPRVPTRNRFGEPLRERENPMPRPKAEADK